MLDTHVVPLNTWKLAGAVTVTLPDVRPYAVRVTFWGDVVVLGPVVKTNVDGVALIVGGGVHVITLLAAGDEATPVWKVLTEVVELAAVNVRKSLVLLAIPIVAAFDAKFPAP